MGFRFENGQFIDERKIEEKMAGLGDLFNLTIGPTLTLSPTIVKPQEATDQKKAEESKSSK